MFLSFSCDVPLENAFTRVQNDARTGCEDECVTRAGGGSARAVRGACVHRACARRTHGARGRRRGCAFEEGHAREKQPNRLKQRARPPAHPLRVIGEAGCLVNPQLCRQQCRGWRREHPASPLGRAHGPFPPADAQLERQGAPGRLGLPACPSALPFQLINPSWS